MVNLSEMSIDKSRQEITKLYNEYKNHYKDFSELVNFIAHKLHISNNEILQIL